RDAAEELDALGLLSIDADLQSPIGIVRARLRPTGYLRAGPSVLPSVIRETYHVLSAAALLTKRDGAAPAETLLAGTKVPLARFDLTIEALVDLGLFTGSGPGDERWGKYRTVRVTALGRRALRGEDTLF